MKLNGHFLLLFVPILFLCSSVYCNEEKQVLSTEHFTFEFEKIPKYYVESLLKVSEIARKALWEVYGLELPDHVTIFENEAGCTENAVMCTDTKSEVYISPKSIIVPIVEKPLLIWDIQTVCHEYSHMVVGKTPDRGFTHEWVVGVFYPHPFYTFIAGQQILLKARRGTTDLKIRLTLRPLPDGIDWWNPSKWEKVAIKPWAGFSLKKLTYCEKREKGFEDKDHYHVVDYVVQGSPAEKAGLKKGDIMKGFDGKCFKTTDAVYNYLALREPGDIVRLQILRDGKEMKLDVIVGQKGKGENK